VNLHYAYPLLVGPHGVASLALFVENHELAVQTLTAKGFTVFTENDLNDTPAY
jgi:predicted dienelactone hydrolase